MTVSPRPYGTRTEEEIVAEESEIQKIQKTLNKVGRKLEDIEQEIEKTIK